MGARADLLRATSALESASEAEWASLRKFLQHYKLERDGRDADARDSRNLLEALRKRTGHSFQKIHWVPTRVTPLSLAEQHQNKRLAELKIIERMLREK